MNMIKLESISFGQKSLNELGCTYIDYQGHIKDENELWDNNDPLQLGRKYKHKMSPNVFLHALIYFSPWA